MLPPSHQWAGEWNGTSDGAVRQVMSGRKGKPYPCPRVKSSATFLNITMRNISPNFSSSTIFL